MRLPLIATALLGLLAACTPVEDVAAPPPPPPPPERLGDANWTLTQIGDQAVTNAFTADMSGGFISGQGPCNRINGNYLGTGPIFRVETVVSTRAACDDLDLEQAIVQALLAGRSADIIDGLLLIRDGTGAPILTFEPVYP